MLEAYVALLGLGIAFGWIAGGRLAGITRLRMRSTWLLWMALALQFSQYIPVLRLNPAGLGHRAILLLSYGAPALWLLRNVAGQRHRCLRIGLALIGAGWVLNAAVILSNNGMPVSRAAERQAGSTQVFAGSRIGRGQMYKHVHSAPTTRLRPFGDVIPLRPLHAVASPGDVSLWLGVLITVPAAMRLDRVRAHETADAPGVAGRRALPGQVLLGERAGSTPAEAAPRLRPLPIQEEMNQ